MKWREVHKEYFKLGKIEAAFQNRDELYLDKNIKSSFSWSLSIQGGSFWCEVDIGLDPLGFGNLEDNINEYEIF